MSDQMLAETIEIEGFGGDLIEAYFARPTGAGPYGSVVVIHHTPGYDEATKEITRKFAYHGYQAVCPNLYSREAPGASPDDAAATARAKGGVPDERLVGDVEGAARFLRSQPASNSKVGVIGYCSGGRQAFLSACNVEVDAAIVCYGASIVSDPPAGSPSKARSIIHLAPNVRCPILGLFGAEDKFPTPQEVAQLDAELDKYSKEHDFHIFEGAGHAFFAVDRPSYRPEVANKGWEKVWTFFGKRLGG
ncbi:MAG: dienelactone hydrolase family protein [Actinomycetota bacterium]|nr:dienelactone hydrolase family protein [Actinomycetota bacterium]